MVWQRPGSTVEVSGEHHSAQCPGQHLGFVTVLWRPEHRRWLPWDTAPSTRCRVPKVTPLFCPCCHYQFHTNTADNPVWLSAEGSALGSSGSVSNGAGQGSEELQQQRDGHAALTPSSEHGSGQLCQGLPHCKACE